MKDRHAVLLAMIEEQGEATLSELMQATGASQATIRRDLQELEDAGRVARTFGGARLAPTPSLVDQVFGSRTQQMRRKKQVIARAAAELVQPGMVVVLDAGTTVWHVARQLKTKVPLTIVTAGLAPLEELGGVDGMTVYVVGGRFLPQNLAFMSSDTVENLKRFHADIAFVGFEGLRPGHGAFSTNRVGAEVGAAVAACANRRVLVGDHTKIDASVPYLILPPHQIDTVITDQAANAKLRQRMAQEPYEMIYAS